jgi:hypothetical protein
MVAAICSAERCDIHDWQMVVDNENGKRPSGRNPWRGMCLRIDALDKIKRETDSLERSLTDHYASRLEFGDVSVDDIRAIVRAEINKATSRMPRKSGGTPL